ncbi:MAG: 50S ribosomal protein L19 [Polyangiaceae bacterium]|nr:50S ribosomal protein L19 [Polyangiaceae bacterium]
MSATSNANILASLESPQKRADVPQFRIGDTVRVNYRVVEGDKTRVQAFQGIVIKRHRGGLTATFTVRKVSFGVGVERTFPAHSPRIESVELVSSGDVRRARLFYLRTLRGKAARVKARKEQRT